MEKDLLSRLDQIEKKHQKLKVAFICIITLLFAGVAGLAFKGTDTFDIIRAKGLVIEDSLGRDRILIGAPIPFSEDRVRTDTDLVRKHWAARYFKKDPDQYMKWYRNYRHGAIGMVVMNEGGFDIVQLGDKLSDANLGRRIFDASGILWNDQMGMELGGAGVNTDKEGKSNASIGIDDMEGEAVHIIAHNDGTKGLFIQGKLGSLLIGMSKKNGDWFKNKDAFTGIKFFDKDGKLMWEQSMLKDGQ